MTYSTADIRPLTPNARRRSWHEPFVRGWWLSAIVMLFVTGWLFVDQVQTARSGLYRIQHWHRVNAEILKIGPSTRKTYRVTVDQLSTMDAVLSVPDPSGTPREWTGRLAAQHEPRSPGDVIPMLVDPANPDHLTDRVTPLPLFEEFLAPLMMLPLMIAFTLLALWQRRGVLKLWRTGVTRRAVVVNRANSAIAPGTTILGCTLEATHDPRLLRVAVPRSVAKLAPGDTINLVVALNSPSRAIAVMLYE